MWWWRTGKAPSSYPGGMRRRLRGPCQPPHSGMPPTGIRKMACRALTTARSMMHTGNHSRLTVVFRAMSNHSLSYRASHALRRSGQSHLEERLHETPQRRGGFFCRWRKCLPRDRYTRDSAKSRFDCRNDDLNDTRLLSNGRAERYCGVGLRAVSGVACNPPVFWRCWRASDYGNGAAL